MFTEHVELTRYFHDSYILREAVSGSVSGCRGGPMQDLGGPWWDKFFEDRSKPCPFFVP